MSHVTITFKNSIQLEGVLLSLEDNKMTIKSLDEISSIIIPNISENVLYYKVNYSEEIYDDISKKTNKSQKDLEKIAMAKGNLNAIERASIREKMYLPPTQQQKDKYVSHAQSLTCPIKHSEKKIERTNASVTSNLQNMFSKKY